MTIGEKIKSLREKTGETATQAGAACGVSSAMIYNWESGANKPGADSIRAIAAHYGITADELLGEAEVT
jgi:transcriptional regulator with XRE-family HTH domain